MQTTTPRPPKSQRKNFLTPDMGGGASSVWSRGAVTDSALGTMSALSSLLSWKPIRIKIGKFHRVKINIGKFQPIRIKTGISINWIDDGSPECRAHRSWGRSRRGCRRDLQCGRRSQNNNLELSLKPGTPGSVIYRITCWQIDAFNRETGLPCSLVGHVVTNRQFVTLIPCFKLSDDTQTRGH